MVLFTAACRVHTQPDIARQPAADPLPLQDKNSETTFLGHVTISASPHRGGYGGDPRTCCKRTTCRRHARRGGCTEVIENLTNWHVGRG